MLPRLPRFLLVLQYALAAHGLTSRILGNDLHARSTEFAALRASLQPSSILLDLDGANVRSARCTSPGLLLLAPDLSHDVETLLYVDAGLGWNLTVGGIRGSTGAAELAAKICSWQDVCFLRRFRHVEMRAAVEHALSSRTLDRVANVYKAKLTIPHVMLQLNALNSV